MAIGTIATIGLLASAAGGVTSTYAGYQQNKFQQKLHARNAAKAQEDAAAQEALTRRDSRRQIAAARARMGASGVEIGAGTPLSVLGDLTAQAEEQALLVRYGGASSAANSMAQSKSSGAAATGSLISGGTKTLGDFASGASDNYDKHDFVFPAFQ